jgi:hypothetical protein
MVANHIKRGVGDGAALDVDGNEAKSLRVVAEIMPDVGRHGHDW